MTIINPTTTTCAACGAEGNQYAILSMSSFGWPDLDLRPPEMRRSTMFAWLEDCPSCGFVAADIAVITDGERLAMGESGWQSLVVGRESGGLANRFRRRAFIEERSGKAGRAAFRTLCAAWVADDEDDLEAARAHRTEAARLFIAALNADPPPGAGDATDWTIQLVDVLRRLGRWEEAADYCQRLIGHHVAKVDAIGRFQARMIDEGDDRRFTMAIAMEEA